MLLFAPARWDANQEINCVRPNFAYDFPMLNVSFYRGLEKKVHTFYVKSIKTAKWEIEAHKRFGHPFWRVEKLKTVFSLKGKSLW